ncbi:MAG TPA: DUF4397 domain-containing protein [Gemmatimonadaceae bacterium]
MLSFRRSLAPLAALPMLAGVTACDVSTTPPPPIAAVRVVNATNAAVDVYIDNTYAIPALGAGVVSPGVILQAGIHQVQFTRPRQGTVLASTSVPMDRNALRTAVAFPGSGLEMLATTLSDTGAIVPEGKTKLRVSNFSQQAIRIYRRQPDFPDSVAIMTPFNYGATSPYLQSFPGTWEVLVVDAAGHRLTTTGAIAVGPSEKRTVIVLDSAGVVRTKVLDE